MRCLTELKVTILIFSLFQLDNSIGMEAVAN